MGFLSERLKSCKQMGHSLSRVGESRSLFEFSIKLFLISSYFQAFVNLSIIQAGKELPELIYSFFEIGGFSNEQLFSSLIWQGLQICVSISQILSTFLEQWQQQSLKKEITCYLGSLCEHLHGRETISPDKGIILKWNLHMYLLHEW